LFCSKCGKETVENAAFCASCGASLAGGQPPRKKTNLSLAAGILDIMAGGFCVLSLIFMVALMLFVIGVGGEVQADFASLFPAGAAVICSILAIVGGILVLRRKNRAMAFTAAIGAALTLSPFGVAALVVTVMARNDFE
jgi:uncharacterized membrane protein YozB (DUF420 family)